MYQIIRCILFPLILNWLFIQTGANWAYLTRVWADWSERGRNTKQRLWCSARPVDITIINTHRIPSLILGRSSYQLSLFQDPKLQHLRANFPVLIRGAGVPMCPSDTGLYPGYWHTPIRREGGDLAQMCGCLGPCSQPQPHTHMNPNVHLLGAWAK